MRVCAQRTEWIFKAEKTTPELISNAIGKHVFVIPVPLALKALFGIVFPLEPQKFREPRITTFNLRSCRVPVIGQIKRAAPASCHLDEPLKSIGRTANTLASVHRVQIENGARIRLFGPWQKALVIFLDQSNLLWPANGTKQANPRNQPTS